MAHEDRAPRGDRDDGDDRDDGVELADGAAVVDPISLEAKGPSSNPEELPQAAASPGIGQSSEECPDYEKKKSKTRKRHVKVSTMHGVTAMPMPSPGSDSVREAAAMALRELGEPDESVLLLDMTGFERKLEEWGRLLPRVAPHYAVKCNADKNLMQRLHELGCSFDCATMEEVHRAFKVGAAPDDVFFSQPCKLRTHLRFARARRVTLMSFADASELRKVAAECPDARLLLRISASDTDTALHFGAPREQWAALLGLAKELRLCVAGISVAGGAGRLEQGALSRLLSEAREVFALAEVAALELLDLGGGFPGDGTDGERFREVAASMHLTLEEQFPASAFPQLRIMAEPGSFFTGNSASLLTKVCAKAELPSSSRPSSAEEVDEEEEEEVGCMPEEASPCFKYYVNDGLYGSFNCVLYDQREVEPEVLTPNCNPERRCSISGPESGGFDTIVGNHRMPELHEGDWLLWRNMGACSGAGSKKTGSPRTKIWYYTTGGAPAD